MSAALIDASQRQRKASDPANSAWVSANAGSGKTYVLAQRVVRLLLAGAPPSRILCLTFTKAAAANMTERVFDRLAKWTQLDDEKLAADIVGLGAPKPTRPDLELARKLFARVIETPGGLKIQTIHAFCERVLHLFPFEANAPAGFRPLDERQSAELRERAQARVFASHSPEFAEALERVAGQVGPDGFGKIVAETARLGEALAMHGTPDAYASKLAQRLGLAPGEDEAAIEAQMLAGGPATWKRWARALNQGTTNDQKTAALLTGAAATLDLALYLGAFLTQSSEPRKTLATKGTTERHPDIVDELYAERDRLVVLLDRRRAAAAVQRSRDLALIAKTCEAAYIRAKAARSALDFDDLIAKTEALFEKTDAAWVLYKLDRGVEHILVDEAQDTSRAQWKILAKLAEDFLSGESASTSRRTFFAVGDEKQSIFSFQGAAPHLFDQMRRRFATRHAKVERVFEQVRLIHSFRSSGVVLDAVDAVFAVPEVWKGVSASDLVAEKHFPIRELPGAVELWPPLIGDAPPEPGEWKAPLDAQKLTHPANALADRIAAVIAQWIAPGSPQRVIDGRTSLPRPIRAGDVLILVRSRGPLFEAMTRALKRCDVACAGADRLTLSAHIAVLDLCAAARVALTPDDDLALAAVLKSPLLGLDDEALIEIAPRRTGSLADALAASRYVAEAAKVAAWRARAGLGPFDFFARLLGADGGRRALTARLGGEAGDAIDEFLARALAHEQGEAPSLTRFLAEIEGADSQIKRDMEGAGEQVRVMTAHAAKGLEAPIVFLPDTHGAPSGRHDPKWLILAPPHSGAAPLPVAAGSAGEDCAEMSKARTAARDAAAGEHRRLLYVAMTRAAQRLIVCGYEGARAAPPDCWRNLIALGLGSQGRQVPAWWNPAETLLRLGEPAPSLVAAGPAEAEPAPAPPPAWLTAAPVREIVYAPAAASRRVAGVVGPERIQRIEEGRLAHRLLQTLPSLTRRRAGAETFLARHGARLTPQRQAALIARALALIEAPELAPLFGPDSRAEVPFAATLTRADGTPAPLSGRIDRLGRAGDEVFIADFKTGAAASKAEYRRQLALYRAAVAPMFAGLHIRAFLIWIDSGEFEELDELTLLKAFENWSCESALPS